MDGWVYLGRWLDAALPTAVWGAGGSVEVARGFRVEVAAQQDANDPLYWNPPRRFWSVGLARAFGPRAAAAAPVPAAAPILPNRVGGRVVIRVPVSESSAAPALAGDFNGWKPAPMQRVGDAWQLALPLAPGVYHYSFRRADGSWFLPRSVTNRVDDGFGGVNGVLVVRAEAER